MTRGQNPSGPHLGNVQAPDSYIRLLQNLQAVESRIAEIEAKATSIQPSLARTANTAAVTSIITGGGGGSSGGPASGFPYDVISYGADRTGASNSTTAFFNACAAASAGGGGAVYVPNGNYMLDRLELPANVMLYGEGESSKIIRTSGIAFGTGWFDMPNPNAVLWRLSFEGGVTTPTQLQYGSGTTGLKFDNDPMNNKLTDNTSIWIHPGADGCAVLECSIRHTGGYAIMIDYRTGDLNKVRIVGNLLENNRPHTFGVDVAHLDYGSWTGGIHYQGIDSPGNVYVLSNCMISGNTVTRATGNCIWGHSYGFDAQATNLIMSGNIIDTVGLDGLQLANATNFVVANNALRRIGLITLTDNDTPVPMFDPLGSPYAVGIDCSGFAQGGTITGNSVLDANGGCYDMDGLCDSTFSDNSGILSEVGEPAYTEDDVANFGIGAGPIAYGVQTSNTSLNRGGTGIIFTGNYFRNMISGAFRFYAARDVSATGNVVVHPAAATVSPFTLGNIGTSPDEQASNCTISGNTIYWDPPSAGFCIAENAGLWAFDGLKPNNIGINDYFGNNLPFLAATGSNATTRITLPTNEPGISTRHNWEFEMTGAGLSTSFKGSMYVDVTRVQMIQVDLYRDGSNVDPVLNVSKDTTAGTGIISTGNRTTFGLGDVMAQGFELNYGFVASLDYANAASVFTPTKANLFNNDWAMLRFNKSTPGWEQSVTTSVGARVWTAFGGAPGGSSGSVQYNNAGSFGGFGTWSAAGNLLTIPGTTGTPAIHVTTAYIESAEGFYTTAALGNAVNAPSGGVTAATGTFTSSATNAIGVASGGVTAKYLNTTESLNIVEGTLPAVSSAGQSRFAMDSTGHILKVSVNGAAYVNLLSSVSVAPLTLDAGAGRVGLNNASPSVAFDAISLEAANTIDFSFKKDASFLLYSNVAYSSGGSAHSPFFLLQRARGSMASPSAVTTGDQIGGFSWRGYDGATGFIQSAIISAFVESTVSSGTVPMYMSFQVGPSAPERMRINNAGHVLIGSGTDNGSGALLQVAGSITSTVFNATNTGSSNTFQNSNGNFSITGAGNIATNGSFAIGSNFSITTGGAIAGNGQINMNGKYQQNGVDVINTSRQFVGAGVAVGGNGVGAGAFNVWNGAGYNSGLTSNIGFNSGTNKLTVGGVDVNGLTFQGGVFVGGF